MTKRKFGFNVVNVDFRHIRNKTIQNVIFENNTEFTIVEDFERINFCIIECENQPRDMPIFGIKWEEIK